MPKMSRMARLGSGLRDYYTARDLAPVLGYSENMTRRRMRAWKPEHKGSWWRLVPHEATAFLNHCSTLPRRRQAGKPKPPPALDVTLSLLATTAPPGLQAKSPTST